MKIKLTGISIMLLLATFTSAVSAEQLFRPRASLGYAMYELDLGSFTVVDSDYLAGGFGATVATDEFYFDFAFSTSLGAEYDEPGLGTFDFERTDLSLTAGKILNNGFSVFVGFKTGESEFQEPGFTFSFEASGLFAGIAKSQPVRGGLLSFNAAVALLDGELSGGDATFTLGEEADTTGLGVGVAYTQFIGNDSGIVYKGIFQAYKFSDFSGALPPGTIPDATETILGGEVSYYRDF